MTFWVVLVVVLALVLPGTEEVFQEEASQEEVSPVVDREHPSTLMQKQRSR
jgi:uncharacterized membrane protein YdfJ with MMPL/SSD domain